MKHLLLAVVLVMASAASQANSLATPTSLTFQRVQGGHLISIGDTVEQLRSKRPHYQRRNVYGWPVDGRRYLWVTVKRGRVCTLRVVQRR